MLFPRAGTPFLPYSTTWLLPFTLTTLSLGKITTVGSLSIEQTWGQGLGAQIVYLGCDSSRWVSGISWRAGTFLKGLPQWAPVAQACWGALGDRVEHIPKLSHPGTMKVGCLYFCSHLSLSQGCSREHSLSSTSYLPHMWAERSSLGGKSQVFAVECYQHIMKWWMPVGDVVCLGGAGCGKEQQHLLLLHWLLPQGNILLLYISLN